MSTGDERALARHQGPSTIVSLPSSFLGELVSSAFAANCSTASTFGSCSSNVITRTFSGCYIGFASFSGTVTLTWSGLSTNCLTIASGDLITRVPNFTVTGRRGATLTVSKTGTNGQRIARTTGTVWSYTNDGIRRLFTSSTGTTLFDYTTTTTSAITINGSSRSSRNLNGGTLRVTDNVGGTTCDYTPSTVAWSSSCNCPTSGSWSGSCSDGKSSTLTINSCGRATFVLDSVSQSVTLDRCYSI